MAIFFFVSGFSLFFNHKTIAIDETLSVFIRKGQFEYIHYIGYF
jgi:hypothetical protein